MKVVFFIHSISPGGAERVTATLANHWVISGWRVTLVTITASVYDFYELDPRIERISLRLDRSSVNSVTALLNNIRRVTTLRRVLKRLKPDVVVSMMSTANVLLALAGLGLDVRTVGSERVHPPTVPIGQSWEVGRRLSYSWLSAMVAQTAQSATWLQQNSPSPLIAVIPNPVNYPMANQEPRISPVSIREEHAASRMLLAVGRLEEQKGFDTLLEAFAKLAACNPEWVLIILGEGSQRSKLEQQSIALGITERIRLLGAVGNISEWFEAADIYVLTSRFEGFPNTLLEALAHGLPAIAVDCETGPRDILRHEEDGLLVPQYDQAALISALERLMSDGTLRQRLGERAVDARERFSVERVARMWEQLFASLSR